MPSPDQQNQKPTEAPPSQIRRVVIEERQRRTLKQVRLSTGYADNVDARARADTSDDAFRLAMKGTLHVREKVRRDFLERSLREIAV